LLASLCDAHLPRLARLTLARSEPAPALCPSRARNARVGALERGILADRVGLGGVVARVAALVGVGAFVVRVFPRRAVDAGGGANRKLSGVLSRCAVCAGDLAGAGNELTGGAGGAGSTLSGARVLSGDCAHFQQSTWVSRFALFSALLICHNRRNETHLPRLAVRAGGGRVERKRELPHLAHHAGGRTFVGLLPAAGDAAVDAGVAPRKARVGRGGEQVRLLPGLARLASVAGEAGVLSFCARVASNVAGGRAGKGIYDESADGRFSGRAQVAGERAGVGLEPGLSRVG